MFAWFALGLLQAMAAAPDVTWETDYFAAIKTARKQQKMIFVQFGIDSRYDWQKRLPAETRKDFVFLKLDEHYRVPVGKEEVALLDHKAFVAMQRRPGFALIDYKNDGPHLGHVVSILPSEHATSAQRILELFDLPAGSLTQRTLIWAIRVHPARPHSTAGQMHPALAQHAETHSGVQAQTNNQHHNLPGFAHSEIVAESWPWNKCPVAAALDMVDAWSHSPGHWREATESHRYYGYDMQRNGEKWFATGVFID